MTQKITWVILWDRLGAERSGSLSNYWDLFLVWPLLVSSLAAGALLFSQQPDDRTRGAKCAAIAVLILLAARRRLGLVIAIAAFLASHRPILAVLIETIPRSRLTRFADKWVLV